jgi:hypothetical protein
MMKPILRAQVAACLALSVTALGTNCAQATPVTFTGTLDFQAPNQAIWGPGNSSAAFGASGATGSAATVRLSYNTGASTGTVAARFAGNFSATYEDVVPLSSAGATSIALDFAGSAGNLRTALGAHLNVTATILNIPITIFDQDYSLDINGNFLPRFAAPVVTGTDSVTVARAAFGPNIVVATAQAGMDGDIREDARLDTTGVLGNLVATHRSSGITRTVPVDLDVDAGESIVVDLGLAGFWDLQFTGLKLENLFRASFLLDLVPFAEYFVGVNCGNPGTDADNDAEFPFFGCVEDGRAAFNLASVPLLSPNFALDFGAPKDLARFELLVVAAPSGAVPEPGVAALLALGLAGLGWSRRKH